MPDLYGYILLVKGLYYLADLNEAIGEARARFMKMYFVEVAKLMGVSESYIRKLKKQL